MDDANDAVSDWERTHDDEPLAVTANEFDWLDGTDTSACDAEVMSFEDWCALWGEGGELSARNHRGQGYTVLSHERAIDHLPSF